MLEYAPDTPIEVINNSIFSYWVFSMFAGSVALAVFLFDTVWMNFQTDILELVESEERLFNSPIRKHQIEFDFTQTIHQLKQEVGLLRKDEFMPTNTG